MRAQATRQKILFINDGASKTQKLSAPRSTSSHAIDRAFHRSRRTSLLAVSVQQIRASGTIESPGTWPRRDSAKCAERSARAETIEQGAAECIHHTQTAVTGTFPFRLLSSFTPTHPFPLCH